MLNESETPKKRKKTPAKTAAGSAPRAARPATSTKKKAAPQTPDPTAPAAEAPATEPTHEQIARKAFELYLARGRQNGDAAEDWRRAEHELRAGKTGQGLRPLS